ncbi:hypothetical protein GCM10010388_65560 [Streptomyces mauvecolor]
MGFSGALLRFQWASEGGRVQVAGAGREVCPGTLHGFTMADTAAFDPARSQRHWDGLMSLLGRTLGKG